jgi:DnaK suppressor protein
MHDDELAALLAAKRNSLEEQLGALTASQTQAGGISFGKRVGEGTNLAVERLSQVAAHEHLYDLLRDVVRAEAKLAAGSYGACDDCGGPIGEPRLEAKPWAIHCVACVPARPRR